jgi:NAD(P)H-hydrate repair Nnr-like enzyme with NAD(P)H-hydrate epimerase domain
MRRKLTDEEKEALATLAQRGRVIAILVPEGIATEDIKALSREVNAKLDELVRKRGRIQ